MDRNYLLLLAADDAFLFDAANQPFGRHFKIMGVYELFVVSGSQQGCFVAEVGNLGPAETWSQGSQPSGEIFLNLRRVDCNFLQMNIKNLPSSF